jgi:hypothetical protein
MMCLQEPGHPGDHTVIPIMPAEFEGVRSGWMTFKNKGCGVETIVANEIAETFARDPKFYRATYCCGCARHIPVSEFTWSNTEERVGS